MLDFLVDTILALGAVTTMATRRASASRFFEDECELFSDGCWLSYERLQEDEGGVVEGVAMTGGEELDDESLADAEAEGYKVAVEECKRCGLDGFWGGLGPGW